MNRRVVFSTWTDHLPFAYDLVDAFRPALIVELGVQAGLSYFTFCQAVDERGVDARCVAIDTWQGDSHTGPYGESIYDDVARYNEANYASFSTLLRMSFDEAVHQFEDASVGLLHIDGLHTYEAVRHDFETWFPKVVPGGIVLFHDVAARLPDFGAWRFWAEIRERHQSFTFRHGYGLGVLRKPGGTVTEASLLRYLFSEETQMEERLRAFYVHASQHVDLLRHGRLVEDVKRRARSELAKR